MERRLRAIPIPRKVSTHCSTPHRPLIHKEEARVRFGVPRRRILSRSAINVAPTHSTPILAAGVVALVGAITA